MMELSLLLRLKT